MAKQTRSAFDVSLSSQRREEFTTWLARELDNALAVRTASEGEVAYWHTLYEQGRTRSAQNAPWPDAADLTSAIGTEKVDTLEAAITDTIFTDPIWIVDGWGESAKKAPFVEEFHQWQAEAEGFQAAVERAIHLALIEPRGTLEVYEDRIRRPVRRIIHAAVELAPDGSVLLNERLEPQLKRDEQGKFIEVTDQQTTPTADIVIDDYEIVANGPRHRVIPYRDFLILPGHARHRSEIWGYAKRFSLRVDQLAERVRQGIYDGTAVKALGTDDEQPALSGVSGLPLEVPDKQDQLAEKELWEVTLLTDLDGTELRWYVATVHRDRRVLLRLQYDDIGRPRYFSFVPFPRPDSVDGYSFIGHKLITIIEEDTAWRNMLADRAALQIQAPLKRLTGALWDPDEEPIGPKAVITVRDMNEVQPLQIPDYTSPAIERLRDIERKAEKVAGVTDIAAGVHPQADRTLGETQLVTRQSYVRMAKAIRNIQETLEEIGQIRHLMWKRALAELGDRGLQAPSQMLRGLELRGIDVTEFISDRRVTVELLEGAFRFKPSGSVETADRNRLRFDFSQSLQALAALSRANPMIAAILQAPPAAKALLEQWARLFNIPDKRAFLGPEAMAAMAKAIAVPAPISAMPGTPAAGIAAPGTEPDSLPPPSLPLAA